MLRALVVSMQVLEILLSSMCTVMGIVEKIQEIEHEISRTQKNKATEYHLGLLKAKLAKYRQQLLEPTTKGSS
ncbi:unnamed protein product, partial [Gongylonema pulchrum]|uniref:Mediator complex subunit 9 n=1 Tax=Gongylonema pulchrum TaxID=637853 RepID=A0A183ECZ4_9BILA